MFDVKQKRMATISGEAYANNPWKKLCRKYLKIKISDERKEKNAHAKKNWTENSRKKQLVTRSVLKVLREKAKGTGQTVDFL